MAWDTRNLDDYYPACDPVPLYPPGNTLDLRLEAGEFSTAERDAIQDGMEMWRAGPSDRMAGAEWSFTLGPDSTSPELDNNDWEVMRLSFNSAELREIGVEGSANANPQFLAQVIHEFRNDRRVRSCTGSDEPTLREADVLFNSAHTFDAAKTPDELNTTGTSTRSMANVMGHELGHVMGLVHNEEELSLMWALAPASGDHGRVFSVDEDEFVFLASTRARSTTAKNLSVSKFLVRGPDTSSSPVEAFWSTTSVWQVPAGATRSTSVGSSAVVEPAWMNLPGGALSFQNLGTQTEPWFHVIWYLVKEAHLDPDATSCEPTGPAIPNDVRVIVEHRKLQLNPDVPYRLARPITVPATTTPGRYRLCVEMDPWNQVAETDETDNTVIMDMIVEVVP